jgi:hypothetical protein
MSGLIGDFFGRVAVMIKMQSAYWRLTSLAALLTYPDAYGFVRGYLPAAVSRIA